MKKIFQLGLAAVLMAGINSCSKDDDPPPANNTPTATIEMQVMSYSPSTTTVAKGTVITWRNTDAFAHTATSDDGTTFDTGSVPGGGTKTYTANTPGTYPYHCTIHGVAMAGTLIVNP